MLAHIGKKNQTVQFKSENIHQLSYAISYSKRNLGLLLIKRRRKLDVFQKLLTVINQRFYVLSQKVLPDLVRSTPHKMPHQTIPLLFKIFCRCRFIVHKSL